LAVSVCARFLLVLLNPCFYTSSNVSHIVSPLSTLYNFSSLERDIVLTGSMDGSARLWNLNSGKTQFQMLVCDKVFQAKTAGGHRTAVTSVCFHPGGREFAMGTSCGSIQIWNASSPRASGRPERVVFHAHGSGSGSGGGGGDGQDYPIHALVYSQDGSRLASRSSVDNCAKVWNPKRLSRSSTPLVTCMGLPTVHERANLAFSPSGKYLCGGATAFAENAPGISIGGDREEGQRQRRRELGSLNLYDVSGEQQDDSMDAVVAVEPLAAIEMIDNNAGPVIVKWHVKLNQILVGCSDGSVMIYYDSKLSRNGALIPLAKASSRGGGRTAGADDLAELIRLRAPKGSAASVALSKGEIIAPLALPRRPNKRQREEQAAEVQMQKREPERPTSGKHKAGGGTTASATTTFAQFIADQTVVKTKAIAGKDPREALLQYTEGKSYLGKETKILDTKTVEQEEEEDKLKKQR
jgi:WD repeat-containing protein 70